MPSKLLSCIPNPNAHMEVDPNAHTEIKFEVGNLMMARSV